MRKSFEELLDGKNLRRLHAEDKALARIERQEQAAGNYIGELCRNGETIYYVFPCDRRYRESASRTELVEFLVRNKYVR